MNRNSSHDTVRWKSAPSKDVAWVSWGKDRIAYHRPSGSTHFLNAASESLVAEMLREPLDLDGVLAAFGVNDTDSDWAVQREKMTALLLQFEHLGLVKSL